MMPVLFLLFLDEERRSPWLPDSAIMECAGALWLLHGMDVKANIIRGRVDDEYAEDDPQVQELVTVHERGRIRPLKLKWPENLRANLRAGRYGALRLMETRAEWKETDAKAGVVSLEITVDIKNTSEQEIRISGEFYLVGDDSVLLSKLGGATEETQFTAKPDTWDYMVVSREAKGPVFVPQSMYYLLYVDAASSKQIDLVSPPVSRKALAGFSDLKVEHLAYGWQLHVPPLPAMKEPN